MGSRKNENKDTQPQGDEYQAKRARNNEAVRRSRQRAKEKAQETHVRVTKLKNENEKLEERIKLLSKELAFLKDIFLSHAGTSHGLDIEDMDLDSILKEEPPEENNATGGQSSSNGINYV